MAEYRVVKLKCKKCGRMVNLGKESCTCSRPNPDVEKVETTVRVVSVKKVVGASQAF